MPEEKSIAEYFGRWDQKKVPLARIFEYTDVISDVIVSAQIAPWKVSEIRMAEKHLIHTTETMRKTSQSKLLYLYDRGYPSHEFIKQHLGLGVDYLFRLPKRFNPQIDELAAEGKEDEDIYFERGGYCARVVFFKLPSGEVEMLLTSLKDRKEVSREDLIKLYHLRWRSEESFKLQKCLMQMGNFLGRSVHGICQEFWSTVLIATHMNLFCKDKEEEDERFHSGEGYKINRNVVFGSLKKDLFRALMNDLPLEKFLKRFERIAVKSKVPIRPDRSYPRELRKPNYRTRYHRAI